MSFHEYIAHYFNVRGMIFMLLVAAAAVVVSVLLVYAAAKSMAAKRITREHAEEPAAEHSPASERAREEWTHGEFMNLVERFYELVFSATSILLFVGIYFSIDYFGIGESYRKVWEKYNSLILLLFILISVMLNSFVDNYIIPLSHVRKGERATMRLAGMLYMLVVFVYIKFFYEDSNYDSIIMYFLTLVIGRFVYFDASFESFQQAMRDVFGNLPILLLALFSTGIVALCGFRTGYLMTPNGVVLNLFIGQLYLLVVIFIVHHGFRIAERVRRRNSKE